MRSPVCLLHIFYTPERAHTRTTFICSHFCRHRVEQQILSLPSSTSLPSHTPARHRTTPQRNYYTSDHILQPQTPSLSQLRTLFVVVVMTATIHAHLDECVFSPSSAHNFSQTSLTVIIRWHAHVMMTTARSRMTGSFVLTVVIVSHTQTRAAHLLLHWVTAQLLSSTTLEVVAGEPRVADQLACVWTFVFVDKDNG